ncbi:hypothetical protein GCM10023063_38650 [Arthrobacter methylotrophus]
MSIFATGFGGFLIMLALIGLITGLYIAATGRRSWAMVPGGRRAGAIILSCTLVLFILGATLSPKKPQDSLDASSAAAAARLATATASPTRASTPTSTPSQTGEPLDPDIVTELATTASYTAPNAQPAYASKAVDLLSTLAVKGRAPMTGYDRSQFGQAWADVDRNGCDTRNDILKRDLTQLSYTNSLPCKVQTGTLADPYTGKSIGFVRGTSTSAAVQIDHVVALGDAWQKGAQQLSLEQRTAFANDPLNLQATDGPTNVQKGDGDTATWLPPNKSFRCDYVARQISVKATYNLWVTQAEHDAMANVLADCPNQTAPTNAKAPATPSPAAPAQDAAPAPAAPAPAPVQAPAPAPVQAPAPAPVQAPAPAPAPVPGGGATAQCNDGTLSYSANHQGTCSHHGGVAIWYK